MEIISRRSVNRWDKDSIRPGPVGSIGDTNVQVMLKKSSQDMPERFDPTFSGKNAAWSGSNVSDGSWKGWTSGGRGAVVVTRDFSNPSNGFKTNVGWIMQNIKPVNRTTDPKLTPLGQYGWDTLTGSVIRAKVSGEMFLPVPGPYGPTSLTRGTQVPTIVSSSTGTGEVLPAADVNITDPVFGDTGTIQDPGKPGCKKKDFEVDQDGRDPVWTPAMDDPRRKEPADPNQTYGYRKAAPFKPGGIPGAIMDQYPEVGDRVWAWNVRQQKFVWRKFNPCASDERPENEPPNEIGYEGPPITRPRPGNQDKRRQDKKKQIEEDKKKKQKLR